jgi:hypothetical protein
LAEIALARKLADTEELLAEAESRLSIDLEYWEDEAFFERDVEALENSVIPGWLVKRLVRHARKRRAKRTPPQLPSQ